MSAEQRFALALDHFGRALGRLHDVLAQPETEYIRDAVIQRFEFTFETAWKAMYRWLRQRGVDADEDAYATIPEPFKRRLISDEKHWGEMRKYRNLTSHTYNESLAIEVAAFVRSDGVATFDVLQQALRERSA